MRHLFAISALLLTAAAPIPAVSAASVAAASTAEDGLRTLNGLGRCFGERRQESAEQMMEFPYGSADQNRAAVAFLGPEHNCLESDAEFDFEANLLVGGVAEGLFLSHYAARDVTAMAAASKAEPRNAIEDLGLCVVRSNPAGVRALIESEPASSSETAVVTKLVPDIGPCVPQGVELQLSKPRMRALLAASLYRLASE